MLDNFSKYTGIIQLLILIGGFLFLALYNQQSAPLYQKVELNTQKIEQIQVELDKKADKELYNEIVVQIRADISSIKQSLDRLNESKNR